MKLTVSKMRDLEKQVLAGEISYSRMVEIINEVRLTPAIEFTIGPARLIKNNESSVALITCDLAALKEFVLEFYHWRRVNDEIIQTDDAYNAWIETKEAHALLAKFHQPAQIEQIKSILISTGHEVNKTDRDDLYFQIHPGLLSVAEHPFKIGDYVLATKYKDADCRDRWRIDTINNIDAFGSILFKETGVIPFKYAVHLTSEEGAALIDKFTKPPFDKY